MSATKTKKKRRRNDDPAAPEFRAFHRHARISPSKARLVMDQIRGLSVSEALDQLRVMKQRSAFMIDKVLKSAIANADRAIDEDDVRDSRGAPIEPTPDVDVDDLYVHDARADDGPRLKRWRPRARGAAYPYRKYFAHLTIRLRPLPGKRG